MLSNLSLHSIWRGLSFVIVVVPRMKDSLLHLECLRQASKPGILISQSLSSTTHLPPAPPKKQTGITYDGCEEINNTTLPRMLFTMYMQEILYSKTCLWLKSSLIRGLIKGPFQLKQTRMSFLTGLEIISVLALPPHIRVSQCFNISLEVAK